LDVGSVLTLLALALALAVQPWSVLAGVLLVTADRGVAKESAYVAGWLAALTVVALASAALYPQVPKSTSSSTVLSWVEIASGVLLGGWLFVRWRRPRVAQAPKQPKWMGRLDSMSPAPAFVLGAFLPNYVVVVAAVGEMMQSQMSQRRLIAAGLVFVVVASLGVAAPLLVLLVRRGDAAEVYQGWRQWLLGHGQIVMYVVVAMVAVVLVAKGVVGLVS
jgi:hypothetical protein